MEVRRLPLFLVAWLVLSVASQLALADEGGADTRTPVVGGAPPPNIVLMMADDMGWSDLGAYGGEIETPHLDALAQSGLRFTQFYNAARCCPTRAALLTGLYPHQAGVGSMVGDDGLPGYRGRLGANTATIAEVLRAAGYRTLMVGKWHVGSEPGHWPLDRGFDRYWGTPSGGGVYFKDSLILRPEVFFVDGERRIEAPDDLYVTDTFTDRAIGLVEEAVKGSTAPFFLYFAHIAPHWPLQAREAEIAKYRGRYDAGWDAVRERRFARQREMGLLPPGTPLSPRDPEAAEWEALPEAARRERAERMAIYAAQIDAIDRNVGRLVARLRDLGVWENTLFLFLSDNGSSAEGGPGGFDRGRAGAPLGSGLSYASAGLEWANAANTPFRRFKVETAEGGIASPLIVHWPAGIGSGRLGRLVHAPAHVVDLLPTLADLAGARFSQERSGVALLPAAGKSLARVFAGEESAGGRELYWEHHGNRAVRVGDWKAVSRHGGPWALHNLASDRTETIDLAPREPARLRELTARWSEWANRVGVRDWTEITARRQRRPAGAAP